MPSMTLRLRAALVLISSAAVFAGAVTVAGAATTPKLVWLRPAGLLSCKVTQPGQACSGRTASKTTGTIKALGATTTMLTFSTVRTYVITVGRTTCSLNGWKGILQLDRPLSVGENVTLVCVDGQVRSIVPAP
jgi:hypothetical protein